MQGQRHKISRTEILKVQVQILFVAPPLEAPSPVLVTATKKAGASTRRARARSRTGARVPVIRRLAWSSPSVAPFAKIAPYCDHWTIVVCLSSAALLLSTSSASSTEVNRMKGPACVLLLCPQVAMHIGFYLVILCRYAQKIQWLVVLQP